MRSNAKIDNRSNNWKQFAWFRVYKDEIKLKKKERANG